MKRPATHLLVIVAGLAVLAAAAFWYSTSREPVEGLPAKIGEEPVAMPPDGRAPEPYTAESCENGGGKWNPCGSPCDAAPGDAVCIQVCEPRCEFPVNFQNVYFPNAVLNPEADCDKVFPVKRFVPLQEAANVMVFGHLLGGVRSEEREEGYFTMLPDGAELISIGGVPEDEITLDFSGALNNVAGSCRVTTIRAQIERTAQDLFPNAKRIVISVNGDAETALQP